MTPYNGSSLSLPHGSVCGAGVGLPLFTAAIATSGDGGTLVSRFCRGPIQPRPLQWRQSRRCCRCTCEPVTTFPSPLHLLHLKASSACTYSGSTPSPIDSF